MSSWDNSRFAPRQPHRKPKGLHLSYTPVFLLSLFNIEQLTNYTVNHLN